MFVEIVYVLLTERLRLEGKSCGSSPLLKLGHLQPVVLIHVQVAFEYPPAGRFQNLFVKTLPVLCHPHSEKVFPDAQRETPAFQFVTIAPGPVNHRATLKKTWLHSLSLYFQVFVQIDEIPLKPFQAAHSHLS